MASVSDDPKKHQHLHTSECNAAWLKYYECMQSHSIMKYFGYCEDDYLVMFYCFKRERQLKARLNHEQAHKDQVERAKRIRADKKTYI